MDRCEVGEEGMERIILFMEARWYCDSGD